MDTPRTLYKITSDSPGTEAAAEAAAALSAASLVFKGVDSNYSAKLLCKSKSVRGLVKLVHLCLATYYMHLILFIWLHSYSNLQTSIGDLTKILALSTALSQDIR